MEALLNHNKSFIHRRYTYGRKHNSSKVVNKTANRPYCKVKSIAVVSWFVPDLQVLSLHLNMKLRIPQVDQRCKEPERQDSRTNLTQTTVSPWQNPGGVVMTRIFEQLLGSAGKDGRRWVSLGTLTVLQVMLTLFEKLIVESHLYCVACTIYRCVKPL